MNKGGVIFGVVCFCVLSLVTGAGAGERFVIRPLMDISYEIESNFYKTHTGERRVAVTTLSPGVELGFRSEKSRIALTAMLNRVMYDDQDDVPPGLLPSDDNDYTGHYLVLGADTHLFTRITAGIDDTWINTRDPEERDRFDNFTDVEEYAINRVRPWMKYQVSDRIAAGFELKQTNIDYDSNLEEDSSHTRAGFSVYYDINRLLTADLAYARSEMDYDMISSDYSSDLYKMNVSAKYKYFKIRAGAGFHKRSFDQAGLSDIETPVWDLSVRGQNPPDLRAGERPKSFMDLTIAQDFNETGNQNEYYKANRVSLTLAHLFMEKIEARINGYYQRSDYELTARTDDTWYLSAAGTYFMNEWAALVLKSGLEIRESSILTNEYDNTFVLLQVNLNYNLGSK